MKINLLIIGVGVVSTLSVLELYRYLGREREAL